MLQCSWLTTCSAVKMFSFALNMRQSGMRMDTGIAHDTPALDADMFTVKYP